MVESFVSRMGKLAFESQGTRFLLVRNEVVAVLRVVDILVWGSPKVLRPMGIDACRPIMLNIFLGAVGCFISVNIKHFWFHHFYLFLQIFTDIALLIGNIKWHYEWMAMMYLFCSFSRNWWVWRLVDTASSQLHLFCLFQTAVLFWSCRGGRGHDSCSLL